MVLKTYTGNFIFDEYISIAYLLKRLSFSGCEYYYVFLWSSKCTKQKIGQ